MRGPLEQLTPGLPDNEVMIGYKAYVVRLADITNPGVPPFVAMADSRSVVGRSVVRDDQLEIVVTLTKQGPRSTRRGTFLRCRPEARCSAGAACSSSVDLMSGWAKVRGEDGSAETKFPRNEDHHRWLLT